MAQHITDFENNVYQYLKNEGYDVLRNGYPDFLVQRKGRYSGVCAIEVKQGNDKVRPNQTVMHNMFKDAGIPVYVIRPEDLYGADNKNIRNPKPKYRFKKIVAVTHYNDMIQRINQLESQCQIKESVLIKLIQNAVKQMSALREEIDSLTNSIKVESVILKQSIKDQKGEKNAGEELLRCAIKRI